MPHTLPSTQPYPYPTLPYPTLLYTLPYPTPTLPLPYPTLPYPTIYPILLESTIPNLLYPTLSLPATIPYLIPTAYPTLPYPKSICLPTKYVFKPRSVLLDVCFGIFLCHFWFILVRFSPIPSVLVRFGKLWHCVDLKPRVGFWLSCWACIALKLSHNNKMTTGIRSRLLFLHLRTSLIDLLFTSFVCPT